jgi:hypothetical protein
MLEPDAPQPAGVDESAITVQRKGSRAVIIDDHRNDFANARPCAVHEHGVE